MNQKCCNDNVVVATRPSLFAACFVLFAFSCHNAWNCWCFVNFTDYGPAAELLHVSSAEVGSITMAGWIGILVALPVVTVCTKRRRLLLFIGGAVNVAAAPARYFAAQYAGQTRSGYYAIVASNAAIGMAFGILSAWPPMLASQMWPKPARTTVTAIASLSNYVGGAVGTVCMPAIATSGDRLLYIFKIQAIVSIPLALAMLTWLGIPADGAGSSRGEADGDCESVELAAATVVDENAQFLIHDHANAGADVNSSVEASAPPARRAAAAAAPPLGLLDELRICARPAVAAEIGTFGIAVGISLLLQGMNQFLLSAAGFSPLESGIGNTIYQAAAAIAGVAIGLCVRTVAQLPRVIRILHAAAAASLVALCALLYVMWSTSSTTASAGAGTSGGTNSTGGGGTSSGAHHAGFSGDVAAMVGVMLPLGAALMGMLPFLVQQVVTTAAPASENVVAGLVYGIAMLIAAVGTQVTSAVSPIVSIAILLVLLAVELVLYLGVVEGGGAALHARCSPA